MKQTTTTRKSQTNFKLLGKRKDSEIDFSDIPELGPDFFKNAVLVLPIVKAAVSIRVDMNVLDWFKATGPGYQTRMNAVLRMYAEQNGMPRWHNPAMQPKKIKRK